MYRGDELLANTRQTSHAEVANGTDETQLNRPIEHILIVKAQSRSTSLGHVLHQSSGAELPVVGKHAVFWHAIAANGGVVVKAQQAVYHHKWRLLGQKLAYVDGSDEELVVVVHILKKLNHCSGYSLTTRSNSLT